MRVDLHPSFWRLLKYPHCRAKHGRRAVLSCWTAGWPHWSGLKVYPTCFCGTSPNLHSDSPPWTVYRQAPTMIQQLMASYIAQRLDRAGLDSALSYFLQAPLRYTLPCILHWLLVQAQCMAARSVYASVPHSTIYAEVFQSLITADTCPAQVRALFSTTAAPLFSDRPDLVTLLKSAPTDYTPPWPAEALVAVLGGDHLVQEAASTMLETRGPFYDARCILTIAAATTMESSDARAVCAVLALAYPPLVLARRALSLLDADRAPASELRNLCACYLQSAALARYLPEGPEAVQDVLNSLERIERVAPMREMLVGARAPLAAVAAAIPDTL